MKQEFTCIVCPNGCTITAEYDRSETGEIYIAEITGNTCRKGEEYARQEIIAPMRTIASSVLVQGGNCPLVCVRLNRPVPKDRIFDVMNEIRSVRMEAPVTAGQVVITNVLGLGSDVIATRSVSAE